MSADNNSLKTNGVTGENQSSVLGRREPLAHPCNCKKECPYGYNRAFCFPCYAKIMAEHRKKKVKEA